MSDELLRFYNSELDFLRNLGKEFAKSHPKTAGYLSLGGDEEYDPHVGRMIQAFAYLNARIRQKLEDDFPEISGSMLDILYPHFQRPIPSMAIVQFRFDKSQAELTSGHHVSAGTMLDSEHVHGHPCRFRTCYPVQCWPIEVSQVQYKGLPFEAPKTRVSGQASAVIKISLNTFLPDNHFTDMNLDRLRFYIRLQPYFGHQVYETLMNHLLGVAVVNKPQEKPVQLGPECVSPVGFEVHEGMLDCPPQSFPGFRLLTEFFVFPEKFMFFDVDLGESMKAADHSQVDLYFFMGKHHEDLESRIGKSAFCLGCTPIINLFKHRCEPLRLTHFEAEYPLIADARSPEAYEVYSIDEVHGTNSLGDSAEYLPFYSTKHWQRSDETQRFWHSSRHWNAGASVDHDAGFEHRMAFVDLDYQPAEAGTETIDINATCFNRNLPKLLEFDGRGRPHLEIEKGSAIRYVECLTKPTATLRAPLLQGTRWQLVSLLSAGHLSLTGAEGLSALKELLQLHDMRDVEQTRKLIAGVVGLNTRPVVGRVADAGANGVCRGLEIELKLDEEQFNEGGMYLMASVLERFFGWFSTINSFSQTVITSNKREGSIRKWPPRAGERVLL